MIEGKQCTVAWYVNDNKISYVNPTVIDNIIKHIEARFGKMTVTCGKHHVFLGMELDFHNDGSLTIKMNDYIKEAISALGIDALTLTKGSPTPARKDLFATKASSPKLDAVKGDLFHRIMTKLLYVSKRVHTDIQLMVTFLCTHVTCSTVSDWLKLKRLIRYLHHSFELFLTLSTDSLTMMKSWVDVSYAVKPDMKSQTGGAIFFGRGAIMSKSAKQKLNTKSSTEAKVVGASDFLSGTIWAPYLVPSGLDNSRPPKDMN